jgi:tRNA nucleotidyltransferase (CCA-adding enzyme)
VPREKWYDAVAQDWFIQRARELEVESQAPAPILLGRHLLELGLEPGPRIGGDYESSLRDAIGWTGEDA